MATYKKPPQQEPPIASELKSMAYQRLLARSRAKMGSYNRMLSRMIHQPAIETMGEIAAGTIGRPSGIIGAGFVASVGSVVYYLIAMHYGYRYNFFIFLLLMAAGFVIGVTTELLWRLLGKSSKH